MDLARRDLKAFTGWNLLNDKTRKPDEGTQDPTWQVHLLWRPPSREPIDSQQLFIRVSPDHGDVIPAAHHFHGAGRNVEVGFTYVIRRERDGDEVSVLVGVGARASNPLAFLLLPDAEDVGIGSWPIRFRTDMQMAPVLIVTDRERDGVVGGFVVVIVVIIVHENGLEEAPETSAYSSPDRTT